MAKRFFMSNEDKEVVIAILQNAILVEHSKGLTPKTAPKGSPERKAEVQEPCDVQVNIPIKGFHKDYKNSDGSFKYSVILVENRFGESVKQILKDHNFTYRCKSTRHLENSAASMLAI